MNFLSLMSCVFQGKESLLGGDKQKKNCGPKNSDKNILKIFIYWIHKLHDTPIITTKIIINKCLFFSFTPCSVVGGGGAYLMRCTPASSTCLGRVREHVFRVMICLSILRRSLPPPLKLVNITFIYFIRAYITALHSTVAHISNILNS